MINKNKFGRFLVVILGINMLLTGCGNTINSHNELMPYLEMEFDEVDNQLSSYGFNIFNTYMIDEDDDGFGSIYISKNNSDDSMAFLSGHKGKIDHISVQDQSLTVMGIHTEMNAGEAIEILKENKYKFSEIFDYTDEEKGDYQQVLYERNATYYVSLHIYGGGETNIYGSLDETDIRMEGTVGEVTLFCVLEDYFEELANDVGDVSSESGMYKVERINDECVELTEFIEDKSSNIQGENGYGTYKLGNNVMVIDLKPGAHEMPYITRISISDICPYKLCGIYYGMDKKSAMDQLLELEIAVHTEEEDSILCDVDPYTTLEVRFTEERVSFIECIDEYPEDHEKKYIEY